jgi:hypothetical protein
MQDHTLKGGQSPPSSISLLAMPAELGDSGSLHGDVSEEQKAQMPGSSGDPTSISAPFTFNKYSLSQPCTGEDMGWVQENP